MNNLKYLKSIASRIDIIFKELNQLQLTIIQIQSAIKTISDEITIIKSNQIQLRNNQQKIYNEIG